MTFEPENGQIRASYLPIVPPTSENDYCKEKKKYTIEIAYEFQHPLNSLPSKPYQGTTCRAYLPNNEESQVNQSGIGSYRIR